MKSICRAALLNDNAPDSELYRTEFEPQRSSNFCSLHLAFAAVEPKRGKYKMSSSKLMRQCGHCLRKEGGSVVKALCMRNKDDINTAHDMKSICRAVLLNDNAPDSELYRTEFESPGSSNFCSLQY